MPTYEAIQRQVKNYRWLCSENSWIAHVFELSGKKPRLASNRIDPGVRKYPRPAEMQPAITEALRNLEP
jgi:hypothetical protein